MLNARMKSATVAALLTLLPGCVSGPVHPLRLDEFRTICPSPSRLSREQLLQIADALESFTHPGLDRLATEWERLDQAARICRGLS